MYNDREKLPSDEYFKRKDKIETEIKQLQNDIFYLEKELKELNQKQTYESGQDVRGGDVYTTTKIGTVGSKQDIEKNKKTLEEKKSRLELLAEELKMFPLKYESVSREEFEKAKKEKEIKKRQEEKEKKQSQEIERNNAFKKMKRHYNANLSLFERATRKIRGKSPDWSKVKKLSDEDIIFLESYVLENTEFQEKYKDYEERNSKEIYNSKEKRKRKWNAFANITKSNNRLQQIKEANELLSQGKVTYNIGYLGGATEYKNQVIDAFSTEQKGRLR